MSVAFSPALFCFSSVHRYVVPLRPLGPFETLCPSEVTPNGDSSSSGGGLASQEGTMERLKPGEHGWWAQGSLVVCLG